MRKYVIATLALLVVTAILAVGFSQTVRTAKPLQISEAGYVQTVMGGVAAVSFTEPLGTKPVVQLTPESAKKVFARIVDFQIDVNGNYLGFTFSVTNDEGVPEPEIWVHYLVIKQ